MNELLAKIRFLTPSLPRAEKVSAQALLENPEVTTHLTLADIVRESNSSDVFTIQFCKRLGHHGYSDLKQAFMAAIAEGDGVHEEGIEESDDVDDILKRVLQSNVQTLQDTAVLVNERYKDALDAPIDAKSVHFFGVGDVFVACQLAFMKFCRLGIPCSSYSDVMLQYTIADNPGSGDVALVVSYEGRSRNVVQTMKITKKRGTTITSIAKINKSPSLRYTDIPLSMSVSGLTVGRDKVTRCVADQSTLDILYLGYITKKKQDFSKRLKRTQGAIDCNKIM